VYFGCWLFGVVLRNVVAIVVAVVVAAVGFLLPDTFDDND